MKKLYWATTYFVIGYALIVAIVVLMSSVPGQLIRVFTFVLSSVIFTEMALRYFKKMGRNGHQTMQSALLLGAYWSILSISIDIALMVILLPLMNYGSISWAFFGQQSSLYWLQFPLLISTTVAGNFIYSKLVSISTSVNKVRS